MKYKVQNTRLLTPEELISILYKSAKLYSEYVDTTLLFIFREKKSEAYDYYEVRFGKNNFMHFFAFFGKFFFCGNVTAYNGKIFK